MAVRLMPLRMFRKSWPSALPWRKTPGGQAGARSPRAPARGTIGRRCHKYDCLAVMAARFPARGLVSLSIVCWARSRPLNNRAVAASAKQDCGVSAHEVAIAGCDNF